MEDVLSRCISRTRALNSVKYIMLRKGHDQVTSTTAMCLMQATLLSAARPTFVGIASSVGSIRHCNRNYLPQTEKCTKEETTRMKYASH